MLVILIGCPFVAVAVVSMSVFANIRPSGGGGDVSFVFDALQSEESDCESERESERDRLGSILL